MSDNKNTPGDIGLSQEFLAVENKASATENPPVKTKTASPTNTPAVVKGQPDAQRGLQQAVESIPVKDYSNYDITIESNDNYSDALFTDEASMQEALDNVATRIPVQANQPTASTLAVSSDGGVDARAQEIDFSRFLTTASKAGEFDINNAADMEARSLKFVMGGLKNSPISDTVDKTDDSSIQELLIEGVSVDQITTGTEAADNDSSNHESKGFAKKLAAKAKAHLNKSKAGFDEYTGRSLPDRTLALEFSLPAQKPKKDIENLVTAYEVRKRLTDKGKSIDSIFKQADSDLTTLNKCQLSTANRLSVLDTYAEPLFKKTLAVIAKFERKPSIAGDSKRLLLALHCHNSVKQLISGYKISYASIYESANILYGPQRKLANKLAFRLFDLLLLEQRLTTVLHLPLASTSTKTLNKLFLVLSLYESASIAKPQASLTLGEISSFKAIYLYYQVGRGFEAMQISSSLQPIVNAYISHNLGLLKLLAANPTKNSSPIWLSSDQHGDKPDYYAAGEGIKPDSTPINIIEVKRFFNAIKKDYAECIECLVSHDKHSSPVLSAFKRHYATTVLCELNRCVSAIENNVAEESYSLYQAINLKAYSELESICTYFNYQYAVKSRPPIEKGEPARELPDKPTPSKCQWYCAMQDEHRLFLQTNETTVAIPLDIGQMLLLIKSTEKESNQDEADVNAEEQLILTRIIRMERLPQGKLNLVVEIISTDMTPITAKINKEIAIPCMLALRHTQRLLITNNKTSTGVKPYSSIPITFANNSSAVIAISEQQAITQSSEIFSLL